MDSKADALGREETEEKEIEMRRDEFLITDRACIDSFLRSRQSGLLSLTDDGQPYAVPLNYAWDGESILLHASKEGRKADLLRKGGTAQFTVYRDYAIIPSYFTHESDPCHATQFFASVFITGRTAEIDDLSAKASALNAVMDQVQGPGGFAPLSANNEKVLPMLRSVAVFVVRGESVSAKFKFGQNLGDETAGIIIGKLLERGTDLDRETAAMMQQLRAKS